jgi:hypothetical protein
MNMFMRDIGNHGSMWKQDFMSVGVISFNRFDLLKRTIESVHKHADMPFELILVDYMLMLIT